MALHYETTHARTMQRMESENNAYMHAQVCLLENSDFVTYILDAPVAKVACTATARLQRTIAYGTAQPTENIHRSFPSTREFQFRETYTTPTYTSCTRQDTLKKRLDATGHKLQHRKSHMKVRIVP